MREKLMMMIVLVAVSVSSGLLLAGVDAVSKDVIRKNREMKLKSAVLSVLGIPLEGRDAGGVFDERIKKVHSPAGPLYLYRRREGPARAAFAVRGSGFWGAISVMVGIEQSDYSITGIEILEQLETPGLGARIEEDRFRDQFRGKLITAPINVRSGTRGPNDVEAITGATMTSRYLETIINEGSRAYLEAVKEAF